MSYGRAIVVADGGDPHGEADTVDEQRGRDEFERIQLHHEIERARLLISQYETGMAYFRSQIEGWSYRLGRLDERLGGFA